MQLKDYVKLINWQKNYIKIKATPNQSKTELYNVLDDNTLKIRIKAIPEKWRANMELISFLSKELEIPKELIEIMSWAGDSTKLIRINL